MTRHSSAEKEQTDFVRYAIAIASVLAAALAWWGARLVLMTDVLSAVTVALFTAAALISTWIAGTGAGFVATAFGAIALLFLSRGQQQSLGPWAPREIAVIAASTALSALVTVVVGRLRARHSALMRGLPDIERRARDRANDAALRRVEEERRTAAAAKEDVADLQRSLQQWKSAASTAGAARADYLSAARLAVRLPLRTMERYAARLRAPARGALTELQREDVDGIAMCEEHIVTLLDTVLAPARVESGQRLATRADVSLAEVVSHALALVEPLLAARGSTVECGTLEAPHVRADAAILTQVLARLILDDVLAAGPGGLRLEATESSDGVTLECRRVRASLTADTGGEDVDETEWSSLAGAEQVGLMGGTVTSQREPGAEVRFTIKLSSRPADEPRLLQPAILWPPVAFELPRPSRSAPSS